MRLFLTQFVLICSLILSANVKDKNVDDYIKWNKNKSSHTGRWETTWIENKCDTTIVVYFINEYDGKSNYKSDKSDVLEVFLEKGQKKEIKEELRKQKREVHNGVTYNVIQVKLINSIEIDAERRNGTPETRNESKGNNSTKKGKDKRKLSDNYKREDHPNKDMKEEVRKTILAKTVIKSFRSHLDSIAFFSPDSIVADSASLQKHIDMLALESVDTKGYIEEQKLGALLTAMTDTLERHRADTALIAAFIGRYVGTTISDSTRCIDSLRAILSARIAAREAMLAPLSAMMDKTAENEEPSGTNWKFIGVCAAIALLIIGLILWYYLTNKADKKLLQNKKQQKTDSYDTNTPPTIQIVGTRLPAPMRKQSLDDVYENPAYLKISATDFCADSAVRCMYIKNTCIKDIYNMYADDLRNPNNPNEDGCMVLGRWVMDEATQTFDVSLEEIVLPGDDAVFAEYELSFGTKIGLKKAERLRKLRKDTGLQYDLTCWVHSHPGLGVFFSNADNNVHLLLKHHAHPHFLTAMVIDILTPQQETGIFTFKRDGAVTSKDDLTRMYSLEEMYRWALDSERRSFDANDYYNTLGTIQFHHNECYGIQLSNGAIIDMTFLTSKPNGYVGFAQGYTIQRGDHTNCIVSAVTKNAVAADSEMLGCFVVATHCSIPSIRKAVAKYLPSIHFVLVYTTTDGLLTSIPAINGELTTSDTYYGEQKLEDLKIWTRRRR